MELAIYLFSRQKHFFLRFDLEIDGMSDEPDVVDLQLELLVAQLRAHCEQAGQDLARKVGQIIDLNEILKNIYENVHFI
jgi:hypothetical protein